MCLYVLFIYSAESLHLSRGGRPWKWSALLTLCVSVYKGSATQGVKKKKKKAAVIGLLFDDRR